MSTTPYDITWQNFFDVVFGGQTVGTNSNIIPLSSATPTDWLGVEWSITCSSFDTNIIQLTFYDDYSGGAPAEPIFERITFGDDSYLSASDITGTVVGAVGDGYPLIYAFNPNPKLYDYLTSIGVIAGGFGGGPNNDGLYPDTAGITFTDEVVPTTTRRYSQYGRYGKYSNY